MRGRRPQAGAAAILALALTVAAAGCSGDGESSDADTGDTTSTTTTSVVPSPVTVTDGPGALAVLGEIGRFSTFLELVGAAGLDETLAVGGPWTVFAPDDAALAALDQAVLDELRGNPEAARAFVLAHVVGGVWRGPDLLTLDGQTVTTEAGTTLSFALIDGVVTIAGEPEGTVAVEPLSLEAANAVIHAVDRPLPPPA